MTRGYLDSSGRDQVELLADERSRTINASLPRDHELIYPQVHEFWYALTQGAR